MVTKTPLSQQDKTVSVDVPEERVAEFYAFFAHFLASDRRRGGGRGPRGRGRHGHGPGGCGHGRGRGWSDEDAERAPEQAEPQSAPEPTAPEQPEATSGTPAPEVKPA